MFDSLVKASAILNTWTWQQATVHQFLQSDYPEDEDNVCVCVYVCVCVLFHRVLSMKTEFFNLI